MTIITQINDVLWGWLLAGILLTTGLYYSIRMGFPQIRHFSKLFASIKTTLKSDDGDVSGFSALCATVGGQVGTGSLVGVASALAAGGPGALFWMWVTAIFGMVLSFGEAALGQVFHEKDSNGNYYGGAPYYMKKGMRNSWIAVAYAICTIFAVGFCIAMLQNNSITSAVTGVIHVSPAIPGLVVTFLAALIVVGGVKRITDVASYIVPFMALGYILITLIIVIIHIGQLPAIFATVMKSAFSTKAAAGGVVGYTMKTAFRQGVARGLFSNDAGNGGAASMHASAKVKHPANQGFAAMLGTFLTTIIICSCTGFAILLTGALDSGADGINLVQTAFSNTLGEIGGWIILLAMFLFGFTTLIADLFYGEVGIRYICKKNTQVVVRIYQILALLAVALGAVLPLATLWQVVDFCAALLVMMNVTALLRLFKYVKYVLQDYLEQLKAGIKEPVWDTEKDIRERV